MSIGNNIKWLRESRDLTQTEFGKIAGVSDKAVSTWENGTAEPRMGAIQKIADYFGVSKGWIIDNDPSSSPVPAPDPQEERLIEVYRSLNDVGRREAVKRVEELAEIERYIKIDSDQSEAL